MIESDQALRDELAQEFGEDNPMVQMFPFICATVRPEQRTDGFETIVRSWCQYNNETVKEMQE